MATIDPPESPLEGNGARHPVGGPRLADGPTAFRRLTRDRLGLLGLCLVAVLIALSIAAPLIAPQDPSAIDVARRLEPASYLHPLGTDNLGRDVLSRLLYGSRWSLGTVAIATMLILSIGIAMGTVAGYVGGVVDEIIMRIVDVLLAFPSLLLALAVVGMLGPGLLTMMIGLVSVWWASYARIVRGLVLSIRDRDFVAAARSLGANDGRIVFRHILPNVMSHVIVAVTIWIPAIVLLESFLGFLGFAVKPPLISWGLMLQDCANFSVLGSYPWILSPVGFVLLAVFAFNALGDGLRDAIDPY